MSKPILKITPKKYSGETTVISMRIAKDMLKDIDTIATDTGYNRNEIITKSLEFALDHMKVQRAEQEGN